MTLNFDSAGLGGIGMRSSVDGKLSCSVIVRLADDRGEHEYANVEVDVLVDRRSEVTLGEIDEQARADAISKLQTALELLESNTLADLRQREREQDAERDQLDNERYKASLSEVFSKPE